MGCVTVHRSFKAPKFKGYLTREDRGPGSPVKWMLVRVYPSGYIVCGEHKGQKTCPHIDAVRAEVAK